MRVLALVLVSFILIKWVIFPVRVTGISMEPTYPDGRIKLVNRLIYRYSAPQRGDIVSIGEYGQTRREMYMKRIVALPGETYFIRDGFLHVNGQRLEEPYVVNRARWQVPPTTLGEDEYLVIGDNRGMHQMHHTFGRVERQYIVGKVIF
jgi:signal peptidase I